MTLSPAPAPCEVRPRPSTPTWLAVLPPKQSPNSHLSPACALPLLCSQALSPGSFSPHKTDLPCFLTNANTSATWKRFLLQGSTARPYGEGTSSVPKDVTGPGRTAGQNIWPSFLPSFSQCINSLSFASFIWPQVWSPGGAENQGKYLPEAYLAAV